MSSEFFWNLTLWDWSLWMDKIVSDRKRESELQEFEWQRLSYLQALLVNIAPLKDKRTYLPTDFYMPSWQRKEKTEELTHDKMEELKKSLTSFPKKL